MKKLYKCKTLYATLSLAGFLYFYVKKKFTANKKT